MYSRKKIPGVYRITNKVNGKNYIGISKSIKKRWDDHKYRLRRGIHDNTHLQSSWNKYGEFNFEFIIVETCGPELFEERENHWINFFDSIHSGKGYNRLLSGKRPPIKETNNSNKLENSSKARTREVVVIVVKTNQVENYDSIKEAADKYQLIYKRAAQAMSYWKPGSTSKSDRKSYGGYIIIPDEYYNPDFDYIGFKRPSKPYKFKTKKPKTKRNYKKNPEDIVPYADRDLGRKPIKLVSENETLSFTSHKEAITTLQLTPSKVNKCLKHPGKYKHRGYFFYPIDLTRAA